MESTLADVRQSVPDIDAVDAKSIAAVSATVAENVDATVVQQHKEQQEQQEQPRNSEDFTTSVATPDATEPEHTQQEPAFPLIPQEASDAEAETAAETFKGTDDSEVADEGNTQDSSTSSETGGNGVSRLDEHDSLVTVRLSEPPVLTLNTGSTTAFDTVSSGVAAEEPGPSSTSSTPTASRSQRATMPTVNEDESDSDSSSVDDEPVNWEQLQQTENEESNGQNADNTAMLLARLEQENAKLATNPKSVRVKKPDAPYQPLRRIRPPSVAQLRDMVQGPTPPSLRYSMLPPPPMTDLEFYAALVQDFHQTAARLPTLLSNKVRKGIPPPLRGVVWQGMTGATRDMALGDQFDRFCNATSPYEGIIGKDLGRSFPGVDMFREPDGDGQRMLGRVLKSYSLHEPQIGYCQGLAFLVGPLLMHMPDKEAFCVLVKLMENYDLRSSYMPDLAGLHVRMFQFRELLRSFLPELSSHLDDLQVDPAAYVSQWFLSFFAVTCPLPMLFRMYDVVFAEGAAETIMRVALSLMQQNEARLLACAELEDAMQLLLSRGLWECYHYNADEFVLHFLSLSSIVTRDRLASLNQAYRETQVVNRNQTDSDGTGDRSSAISTIASRFLGRLWASTSSSSSSSSPSTAAAASSPSTITPSSPNPNANTASGPLASPSLGSSSFTSSLSLGISSGLSAPLRPLSMLQRSSSKHSLASTVNSMEASSAAGPSSTSSSSSSVLSSSTDATSVSRDSASETKSTTVASNSSNSKSADKDRFLHIQIEDLLTALGDSQRQHALATDQLQREREERREDHKAVHTLLGELRGKCTETTTPKPPATVGVQLRATEDEDSPAADTTADSTTEVPMSMELSISQELLFSLFEPVEARIKSEFDNRRSSAPQTKAQLRDELGRAKEKLANEISKSQDRDRRVYEMEQEVATMKEQLRDSHARARVLHQDKQRLERQTQELRARVASETTSTVGSGGSGHLRKNSTDSTMTGHSVADTASEWFGRATGVTVGSSQPKSGGLRELKLGRSKSTPTSQAAHQTLSTSSASPGSAQRSSSLVVRGAGRRDSVLGGVPGSGNDHDFTDEQQDALVLELVQSKTSEAVARQEAEEARQRLESLRKTLGLSASDLSTILHSSSSSSSGAVASATSTAMGLLGKLTTSMSSENNSSASLAATANTLGGARSVSTGAPPATTASNASYGFFGWRR
ncbi:gtpase activating protein [Ophiostoma piceae UAMH 11346]|uniref:Gtpase activating protein n=1 Tax=Ophiostoma piceae (strain UAMH 11346) TaxID=1262450 RepID=S3BPD4_OPHP1|nr:gtpase activating protein [Ophiostoma piceae UAMH 11346]